VADGLADKTTYYCSPHGLQIPITFEKHVLKTAKYIVNSSNSENIFKNHKHANNIRFLGRNNSCSGISGVERFRKNTTHVPQ